MNFLSVKTKWSSADLAVLKGCVASAYVLIGAYFHEFFLEYYIPVLAGFTIFLVWVVYLWTNKMAKKRKQ